MNRIFDCWRNIFIRRSTRLQRRNENITLKSNISSVKETQIQYPNIELFTKIPDYAKKHFKAASIVPFARNEGKTFVLLGLEFPSKKDPNGTWCDFGGKVDPGEENKPEETALREFNEETGFIYEEWKESMRERLRLEEKQIFNSFHVFPQKIWFGSGKFLVFFMEIPFMKEVRELFKQKEWPEMQDLGWFPVSSLIRDESNQQNDEVEVDFTSNKKMRKFFYQRLRSRPFQSVLQELSSLDSLQNNE